MSSYSQSLPSRLPTVVGLLGGSFNPAHAGHVHISQEAMRLLGISHVWWMVSPQNPLKPAQGMEDFDTRLSHATELAADERRIVVSDIESAWGSTHTANTLKLLKQRYPNTRFIWLMGADNLASIDHWEKWNEIFSMCSILVLDRAPLSHRALQSNAAIRYKNQKVDMKDAKLLTRAEPPLWCFAHIKKHPESATNLRKTLGKKAFLG